MRVTPVLAMNSAGLWLLDCVWNDLMNAILSTCCDRCGNSDDCPHAALAVLLELERRFHQRADRLVEEPRGRVEALELLPVGLVEPGL